VLIKHFLVVKVGKVMKTKDNHKKINLITNFLYWIFIFIFLGEITVRIILFRKIMLSVHKVKHLDTLPRLGSSHTLDY